MLLRRKRDDFERPAPPASVVLDAIGYVRSKVVRPRPRGWEKIESSIEILPAQRPALAGIEAYSHIIVVFYMDIAAGAPEKPAALRLAGGRTYGILATRSQLRPNHLGVSVVPLLRLDNGSLIVRGLDAVNHTPVLDIKPYLPQYDAFPGATIPAE
jgi:tRNA-Thr(GGU) m(6)t(6)A37 methyltransferase TsaA